MGTSESSPGDKTREGKLRSLPMSYASSERGIRALSSSSRRTVSTSSAARRIRASGSVRVTSEETQRFCGSLVERDAGRKVCRGCDPLMPCSSGRERRQFRTERIAWVVTLSTCVTSKPPPAPPPLGESPWTGSRPGLVLWRCRPRGASRGPRRPKGPVLPQVRGSLGLLRRV